jgi:crossover junction endodeoxyribonuclease RuvC
MCIGIDPGLTGAIATLCGNDLHIRDIPVVELKRGRTVRHRVDMYAIQLLMNRLAALAPDATLIEDVWGLPGQSAPAAHAFGVCCGQIQQACVAANLAPKLVAAATWKLALRIPSDKGAALDAARKLWPGAPYFHRAKDHGRAEAALIARYAQQIIMS